MQRSSSILTRRDTTSTGTPGSLTLGLLNEFDRLQLAQTTSAQAAGRQGHRGGAAFSSSVPAAPAAATASSSPASAAAPASLASGKGATAAAGAVSSFERPSPRARTSCSPSVRSAAQRSTPQPSADRAARKVNRKKQPPMTKEDGSLAKPAAAAATAAAVNGGGGGAQALQSHSASPSPKRVSFAIDRGDGDGDQKRTNAACNTGEQGLAKRPAPKPKSFNERLSEHEAARCEKLEQLRREREQREMRECTFTPVLSSPRAPGGKQAGGDRRRHRPGPLRGALDPSPPPGFLSSSLSSLGEASDDSLIGGSRLFSTTPAKRRNTASSPTSSSSLQVRRRAARDGSGDVLEYLVEAPHYMRERNTTPARRSGAKAPAASPQITPRAKAMRRTIRDLFQWEAHRLSRRIGPADELLADEVQRLQETLIAAAKEEEQRHAVLTAAARSPSASTAGAAGNAGGQRSVRSNGSAQEETRSNGTVEGGGDGAAERQAIAASTPPTGEKQKDSSAPAARKSSTTTLTRQLGVLQAICRRRNSPEAVRRARRVQEEEAAEVELRPSPAISARSQELVRGMGDRRVNVADHAHMCAAARAREAMGRREEVAERRQRHVTVQERQRQQERLRLQQARAQREQQQAEQEQAKTAQRLALHYEGLTEISSDGNFTDSDRDTDSSGDLAVDEKHALNVGDINGEEERGGMSFRERGVLGGERRGKSGTPGPTLRPQPRHREERSLGVAHMKPNTSGGTPPAGNTRYPLPLHNDPHHLIFHWFQNEIQKDVAYRANVPNESINELLL